MRIRSGRFPAELKRSSKRDPLKPMATTIDNACCITGLGRTKVYELISEGTLKTVTVGRRRLVLFSSIEALLGTTA